MSVIFLISGGGGEFHSVGPRKDILRLNLTEFSLGTISSGPSCRLVFRCLVLML